MMFTDEMFKQQAQQVKGLIEELERLSAHLESQMRAVGVTESELRALQVSDMPPEVQQAFAVAEADAKRAGSARAAQTMQINKPTSSSVSTGRRGMVRA